MLKAEAIKENKLGNGKFFIVALHKFIAVRIHRAVHQREMVDSLAPNAGDEIVDDRRGAKNFNSAAGRSPFIQA